MVFATYSEDGGISIHTPTKGATVKKFTQLFSCIFQSTLPRRERQRLRHRLPVRLCISIHTPTKGATRSDILRKCAGVEISIHTPTKGATSSVSYAAVIDFISIHTPTKGATNISVPLDTINTNFNPHSHEGSDYVFLFRYRSLTISIHTPTKGATSVAWLIQCKGVYFNPHSHEGSDGVICTPSSTYKNFNPHSHEGSDNTYTAV